MAVTVVVGSQWGDEGKGKFIDYLAEDADYVVRFHGGNNAGHTVINQYGTFPLHLVPSGIFSPRAKACISNGTVLDLEVLTAEIAMLEKAGIPLKNKLYISPRCHLIMPYHKLLDRLYEQAKGKAKTGTTGRGIGPVYADKVSYNGIRLFDVMDKKKFSEKLAVQLRVKNKVITALGEKPLKQKEIEQTFFQLADQMKEFIHEPYGLLHTALEQKKSILLEGAQGVFLDNDWGTYPFVTGSTVLAGGGNAGSGIPAQRFTDVIGVVKAYTTRVGEGPFPTELLDQDGEKLRKEGHEFGTTTGRSRRCGWFDAELINFAAQINGYTSIAVTKLDVLDTFAEIKVCVGYTRNNKKARYYDGDAAFLDKVKPVYKTYKGWLSPTKGVTKFTDLPKEAKAYLAAIERHTGTKVSYISTGPERESIIRL